MAEDDAQRCRVWVGLAGVKRVTDDVDGAFTDLERAEAAARAHGLKEQLAGIHFLRGNLYFPRGDIEGCLGEHRASLGLAREIGSVELEVQALGGLGDGEYMRGRMRSAHTNLARCVALCREHGFGRIEVANLSQAAHAAVYLQPQRAVLQQAIAAAEAARRIGHQRAELNARAAAIFSSFFLRWPGELRTQAELAHDLIRSLGAVRYDCSRLAFLGRAALLDGDRETALELLHQSLRVAHKTGITFEGPRNYGALATALVEPEARRRALAQGEAVIASGCVGHNQPWFYADAIQVMLDLEDWEQAERYASALEDFTRPEPLPWCDLVIARGRALGDYGRGRREGVLVAELRRVQDEARRLQILVALPAIERALA